jgi:hypothetical protein
VSWSELSLGSRRSPQDARHWQSTDHMESKVALSLSLLCQDSFGGFMPAQRSDMKVKLDCLDCGLDCLNCLDCLGLNGGKTSMTVHSSATVVLNGIIVEHTRFGSKATSFSTASGLRLQSYAVSPNLHQPKRMQLFVTLSHPSPALTETPALFLM